MRPLLSALALCALLAQAPAAAEELRIDPDARFEHRYSKIVVPPMLNGLPRVRATEFAPDQLDVAFHYSDPDNAELVTLYVYRLASGSMPLWFDRARLVIESNDKGFGKAVALDRDPAFVPPGQSAASGLVAVYATEGGYSSTGLAMAQVGEWLVKLRLSSASLSPEQLQNRIAAVLAEIKWPKQMAAAPAAVPVAACAAPLPQTAHAKPTDKPMDAMMGALIGAAVTGKPGKGQPVPVTWCRDSAMETGAAVYRADGETNAYLLALSDAGRAIRVMPTLRSQIDPKEKGWLVDFIDLGETVSFAPLDALPPPDQVMELFSEGKHVSVAQTWGKGRGRTIQLSSDAIR